MNRISHDPSGLVRRKTSTNWSLLQKPSFRTYLSRHPTLMIVSSNNISVAARTSRPGPIQRQAQQIPYLMPMRSSDGVEQCFHSAHGPSLRCHRTSKLILPAHDLASRPVGTCSRRTPMTPPSVARRGDCRRGLINSQSHHARRVHSVAVWHDCVGGAFVEHLSPIITCATAVIGGAQDLTEESYLFNERRSHRNTSSDRFK
jgi:hypothetical protein